MCIDPAKTYTATIDTSEGSFTVALDAAKAPNTVNNFVVLSRYHFYDGLTFHRIEPGFVSKAATRPAPAPADRATSSPTSCRRPPRTTLQGRLGGHGQLGPGHQRQPVLRDLDDTGFDGPNYSLFGQVTEGFDTTVTALETAGSEGRTPTITSVTITES